MASFKRASLCTVWLYPDGETKEANHWNSGLSSHWRRHFSRICGIRCKNPSTRFCPRVEQHTLDLPLVCRLPLSTSVFSDGRILKTFLGVGPSPGGQHWAGSRKCWPCGFCCAPSLLKALPSARPNPRQRHSRRRFLPLCSWAKR